jgi:hypothetical protein
MCFQCARTPPGLVPSGQAVLDQAVERYRRARFLRGANADFTALRKDSTGRKEEQAERGLWDQTLADGLEGE